MCDFRKPDEILKYLKLQDIDVEWKGGINWRELNEKTTNGSMEEGLYYLMATGGSYFIFKDEKKITVGNGLTEQAVFNRKGKDNEEIETFLGH